MQLFALGVNHQTAPLAVRERVAFHAESVGEALRSLTASPRVREAAILSTCNRTELYCNTADPQAAVDWMAGHHGLCATQLTPYLYELPQTQAVTHAFRVASGLDSMMLGEPQILGQMKQAARVADQAGTLGVLLHKLFQRTFSVAKEVRSATQIGASQVSMAAVSLKLAERIFPSVAEQRLLFIGAGEMIELCATYFAAQRPREITVANRTLGRAQSLAERVGGSAMLLAELPEHLARFDIVITSTASPLPILGKGLVEKAVKARRHRPVLMIDLAVPRDVEPEVAELDDIFLYTVDDLGKIVHEGVENRQTAVTQAEAIIRSNVTDFMRWLDARNAVPTIRLMREHADRLREAEFDRARRRLAHGEDPARVLESFGQALTNKFLHIPSHALNHASGAEREELIQLLTGLYGSRHE